MSYLWHMVSSLPCRTRQWFVLLILNFSEPENEIVMVEREGKTCFSMEEQPKCQPGDELFETENRKVKLSCLPRSDRRTRRIMNALKRGESVKEEVSRFSSYSSINYSNILYKT